MKYIVIDIETSGLDADNNKILSVAAIAEDSENVLPYKDLPKFHVGVLHYQVTGSFEALAINSTLIGNITRYLRSSPAEKEAYDKRSLNNADDPRFLPEDKVAEYFFYWLQDAGYEVKSDRVVSVDGKIYAMMHSGVNPVTINAAGKNFGTFDKLFLEKLPRWKQFVKVKQRILDPAILYVDWKTDENLPNLETCKRRANLDAVISHNALEDAWDTLQVLRSKY